VLADEVGFGKTYEALAVMTLLCDRSRRSRREFSRVLVLCKSSLLRKWLEEVSSIRPGSGFPQYLQDSYWKDHPVRELLEHIHVVERRWSADELRSSGLRGRRRDGHIQVPGGLYIVNHYLMSERAKATRRPFLTQLWNTQWDLIVVDEAQHYARWNRPAYIFAPDGDFRNYDQGIAGGKFRHILALTATPFELTPKEMVNLLALVKADPSELADIETGLDLYVSHLDRFFALRQRSPDDPLRAAAVQHLRRLRDEDALGTGRLERGLQLLLKNYLIRNTKSQNERRYFLANKDKDRYQQDEFDKFDDLHHQVQRAPLLPFDGPDALFYLELRELIQETVEQAREGIDLQKQCRYVVHYDLEWNPARMEQREGRVDRVGWGRSGEGFIDVRFMLLKGTYEERIFHTVIQRDQWFQILIGSKRRELGEIKDGDEDGKEGTGSDTEDIEEVSERGRLMTEEKQAVMLDLRPSPVTQHGPAQDEAEVVTDHWSHYMKLTPEADA
jgi:hypothetical protein